MDEFESDFSVQGEVQFSENLLSDSRPRRGKLWDSFDRAFLQNF